MTAAQKQTPDMARARQYLKDKEYQPAAQLCLAALQKNPQNADAHAILGIIQCKIQHYDKSEKFLSTALMINPSHDQALLYLGSIRTMQNRYDEAHDMFRRAWKINPNDASISFHYISTLERFNKKEEAEDILRDALEKHPDHIHLRCVAATLQRRKKNYRKALELLKEIPDQGEALAIINAYFERARNHDKLGNYNRAFQDFSVAQECKEKFITTRRAKPDKGIYPALITEYKKTLSSVPEKKWTTIPDHKTLAPHFLIGFPRSGTTLLQQMLDAHPSICCSDEIPAITKTRDQALEILKGGLEKLPALTEDEATTLRSTYELYVNKLVTLKPGQVYIDKNPMGLIDILLLYRLFPRSKFIIALRHPCDTVLSCYMQDFEIKHAMVNMMRLDTATALYCAAMELLKQMEKSTAIQLHYICYEDIISHQEEESRKLLEFLDLPWDDAVINYREHIKEGEMIKTASYQQVVQPIYKTAKGRWEHYRTYLEPYLEQLEPWIKEFGYEER